MPIIFELEHAIGFSGAIPQSAHFHSATNQCIYIAGKCVVLSKVDDPTDQTFLRGHHRYIWSAAFSPSGRYLATGERGVEADVCVWDLDNEKMLFRFEEHYSCVTAVAFSHDEKLLATVGGQKDQRVVVWDLQTGNIVSSTVINFASRALVEWGGFEKDVKRRSTGSYILAMALDQSLLLCTLDPYSGTLKKEKINTGSFIRDYTALSFSKASGMEQEFLYAGSETGDISCIHVRTKSLQGLIRVCSGGVRSITVDNREVFVGGGDSSVNYMEGVGKDLSLKKKLSVGGPVTSIALGDHLERLLIGTSTGHLYLGDRKTMGAPQIFSQSHEDSVLGISFQRDSSETFSTCSADGTVRCWSLEDYSVVSKGEAKGSPTSICYERDIIFSGYSNGNIKSFDCLDGTQLWSMDNAHKADVTSVKVSNNIKFFISGDAAGSIRLWEIRYRELVCEFKEHGGKITDLAPFPNNMQLLSSSKDKSIMCWDLQEERRSAKWAQRMGSVNSIALLQDQTSFLSVGSDKNITYWDLRSPKPSRVISYGEVNPLWISLSNDNTLFATGGSDHVVRLFDTQSGSQLAQGVGHSDDVMSLSFSPDDKQVVSVGNDGCIFVWNIFD